MLIGIWSNFGLVCFHEKFGRRTMGEAEAFSLHFPRVMFFLVTLNVPLYSRERSKKGDSKVIWGLNQQPAQKMQAKMELVGKGLGCDLIVRQSLAQTSESQSSRPGCSIQCLLGKGTAQVGAVADVESRIDRAKKAACQLSPLLQGIGVFVPLSVAWLRILRGHQNQLGHRQIPATSKTLKMHQKIRSSTKNQGSWQRHYVCVG